MATGTSKAQRVSLAKQQLCTCIALFCSFPRLSCTTTTWNDQILSWHENGNGEALNFTIFVWTRTRSPLISSDLTSLLSGNWLTWYKVEKVSEDVKSIFQRHFHWRRRCRVVRSLLVSPETGKLQCCVFLSIPREKWKKKKKLELRSFFLVMHPVPPSLVPSHPRRFWDVTSPVKLVGKFAAPLLTRIARNGLGTRLSSTHLLSKGEGKNDHRKDDHACKTLIAWTPFLFLVLIIYYHYLHFCSTRNIQNRQCVWVMNELKSFKTWAVFLKHLTALNICNPLNWLWSPFTHLLMKHCVECLI